MPRQKSNRAVMIEDRMDRVEKALAELTESHVILDNKLNRLSDEVRQTNILVRQTNEAVRQTNESVKQTNEAVKQTNESVKQTNEAVNQTNGSIRMLLRIISPPGVNPSGSE